ncbi:MAG: hypothetical protein LBL07_02585 [Tannerella sp.]|jgi:uncharacterized protein YihD (DUF1040 family)|nr:hypothetical protein [Tannerella sp.]
MARKFNNDEIKWILSVEATGVQAEIQALSSESENLKRKNESLTVSLKKMTDSLKKNEKELNSLEKKGQATSARYEELNALVNVQKGNIAGYTKRINENAKAIQANNKKISETTRLMKLEDMTMSQLKKRASDLRNQLNHTAKATSPEAYAKLEKELKSVNDRMNQLKGTSSALNDTMKKSPSIFRGGLMVLAGNLMLKAIGYVKQLIGSAKEWIGEGVEMASTAEGVISAFQRLGQPELLKNLRKETKGLINDFILMQSAVRAKNFGIPIEKLGTLLKFAQQRAQETGESVDYLAKSIINGIGRKSPLILDNLGISTVRLQEQVKKTGDFTAAVIQIVNEELEKQGDLALTSADRSEQAAVKWQNNQLKVGKALLGVKNLFSQLSSASADWFSGMTDRHLPGLLKQLESFINELIDLYNNSIRVRIAVRSWITSFKAGGAMIIAILKSIGDNIIVLAKTANAALKLDFKGAIRAWDEYGNSIRDNYKAIFDTIRDDAKKFNKKLEKVNLTSPPETGGNTDNTDDGNGGGGNDKKEHEKRLKEIDTYLEQEINILKKRRLEGLITEKEYSDKVAELTLSSLKQKLAVKGQEQDQLVKYESQILDLQLKLHEDAEKADVTAVQKSREQDLRNLQDYYNKSVATLNQSLADKKITKQQHEMMLIELDKNYAENRLKVEQEYYRHAQSLELQNADLKVKLVEDTGKQVLEAEKTANAARLAEQQKLNGLIKDFKGEFKVTTVDEDYRAQQTVLEASYQARREMAEKNGLDTLELDKAYLRAKEQLQQEHKSRLYSIRQQYGLVTLQEEYSMELLQLQTHLNQQILTQKEYEKAVQKLKRDSVKKQFDYYKTLFSDAVTALQDNEIANIERKYDVEIEAAQGNSEEVARLEEEKAQKKLEVEKKFADVNFAIKASQIIADTAVGMMAAFQLGPIAGAIAAALIGITGVAQLAMANAERNKVKNMTLSSGGSSSSNKTGARVASGREDGGRMDIIREQDGKYFPGADFDPDKRGYVDRPTVIVGEGPAGQSREWIAGNAAVTNPTVAPVLDLVDKAQQAGTIRSLDLNAAMRARAAGYATGGAIDKPPTTPATDNPPASGLSITTADLVAAFVQALSKAEFTAPVVLSELEARKKRLDVSRNIGSKH